MVSARPPPPLTATSAARSILRADRRAVMDAGERGRIRGRVVAGSLVLLGLSDLPYPPWLCDTVLIYPPSSRGDLTSALHGIVLSGLFHAMWRGMIGECEMERNGTE